MSYTFDPSDAGPCRSVRDLVAARRPAYGAWCMIDSPLNVEVIARSGVDWLCIDLQHGLIDEGAMRRMVQAAGVYGTPVLIRAPWNEPAAIMRALDSGADGVIVPMVNGAAEARLAATATKFPPQGNRSWGPLRPALLRPEFNPELANQATVCLVMVETVEAVEALDEILEVPSIDGVFVGPKDLALSHRQTVADALENPWDTDVLRRIATSCATHGLVAASICDTIEQAVRLRGLGFSLLALQTDAAWLGRAAASALEAIRQTER